MTRPLAPEFRAPDPEALPALGGRIALIVGDGAKPGAAGRRLDRAMKGALARFLASPAFECLKDGEGADLAWPTGLAAEAVQVIRLARRADVAAVRKAGAAIGRAIPAGGVTILADHPRLADLVLGAVLRAYDFNLYHTATTIEPGTLTVMTANADAARAAYVQHAAVAEGVLFTRDLVNEPANVLTTADFADRLADLRSLGLKVEVLEEADLAKLGMRALLGVGQGSESPSKVVVMEWAGGQADAAPLALVGKGVVFDTGGISIKPAAGMEDMTMDMGGAGVVAGVMRTLALRKARANVVGLVGLVENMPDGRAQRPGDIVRSMKGDTIEVINTDAEGRLVLADVLWYAQERFRPRAMIDLATLTGAIIVGLGHENAGVFSNDDALCDAFLAAARAEGEGAWRMPMGPGYDAKLKSRLADMRNSCGRDGGAITAAHFLARFVKSETPWIHLDIAGVALLAHDSALAPKGATGWGVMAINRMIRDMLEG